MSIINRAINQDIINDLNILISDCNEGFTHLDMRPTFKRLDKSLPEYSKVFRLNYERVALREINEVVESLEAIKETYTSRNSHEVCTLAQFYAEVWDRR